MYNTKKEKIMIQKISKINKILVRSSLFGVFLYVLILGATSSKIVVNKGLISKADDIKSELAFFEQSELQDESTDQLMHSALSYKTPDDLMYVYPNLDNTTAALFAQLKQ